METEIALEDTNGNKIEAAMGEAIKDLETAHRRLPHLMEKLGDSMARAALGEDNHTQIARIKRRIAELEETIQQAPLVIKGLKRMQRQGTVTHH